jgi:6-phosphogluconolactonase
VGPDGHTASIFPGHAAVHEHERRCLAVLDSPKPPPRRLTLTPRALAEARDAIVLATGSEKAAAVAGAFAADATPARCPAVLLRKREWFVDRAAAQEL